VDLLDRALDKGVILDADLIVHVAGIPLLGVSLRAALAGVETMLRYGMWVDWDEAQRVAAGQAGCGRNGGELDVNTHAECDRTGEPVRV
jgi:hypothetical protein